MEIKDNHNNTTTLTASNSKMYELISGAIFHAESLIDKLEAMGEPCKEYHQRIFEYNQIKHDVMLANGVDPDELH